MSPGPGPVVGPVPDGRQPETYDRLRRRILWSLPTGLYVLGSGAGPRRNLMTISWVTQVATEPKLVAVSIESSSVTAALVAESGTFALSLLPRQQRAVVRKFAKPVLDAVVDEEQRQGTMNGEEVHLVRTGDPVLAQCAAWLECVVRHRVVLGSHNLFVGEVTDCGLGAPSLRSSGDTVADEEARAPGEVLRMEDTRMNYGG